MGDLRDSGRTADGGLARLLDTTGHRCPIPVVRTEAALRGLAAGAVLDVLADDPLAAVDIPHFCRQAGHAVTVERLASAWRFRVTKSGGAVGSAGLPRRAPEGGLLR